MQKIAFFLLLLFPLQGLAQSFSKAEIERWEQQAKNVTIIRDNYGIPHIYGKTDADAVFGLLYAQCEDDFKRVEMNYLEKLGLVSLVKGENSLYDDLLNRMIIDTIAAKKDFQAAPLWLKQLCVAFADAVNYYLYKHPQVKPAVLQRFQPWLPLLWTDGSIGAISTADVSMNELKSFYSTEKTVSMVNEPAEEILTGSNGFAVAPSITENGNAILYINPHVTFYFRPEVHMVSEQGLNAYGAVTWGQFFIYQGFNEFCGWMHTSSGVDAADSYAETINNKNGKWSYLYKGNYKPVIQKKITIAYKSGTGIATKTFTTLSTHHGPVMAKRNEQLISVRADNRIMNGLIQCWQRTKAKSFDDFKKTLDLKGNISNNTVYADAAGNIAYWHGNRIPLRDTNYDWSKPVDGSIAATEWKGLHAIKETIQSINPSNGWLQNCNSTPFTVAGAHSPKKENYPAYMAPDGENFRGVNAVRVLAEEKKYTIDKVIKAGYDTRLTAFEILIPALVHAFESTVATGDSLYTAIARPVAALKSWDHRANASSYALTIAIEWAQRILPALARVKVAGKENPDQVDKAKEFAATASASDLLLPLVATIKDLQSRFGKWQVYWGDINRFQRISGDIENRFDDNQPSLPVAFVSSAWGMLPSYTSRTFPGTIKRYGVNGNSFICAVEFGNKIKAKSLLAGGESGDPSSKHFFDQGAMYSVGQFKEVLFYKDDVVKQAEKTYHPGE